MKRPWIGIFAIVAITCIVISLFNLANASHRRPGKANGSTDFFELGRSQSGLKERTEVSNTLSDAVGIVTIDKHDYAFYRGHQSVSMVHSASCACMQQLKPVPDQPAVQAPTLIPKETVIPARQPVGDGLRGLTVEELKRLDPDFYNE